MESSIFLNIIIDRVGATNVFNVIQGKFPGRDTHLQSDIDDDMIDEFLSEIERLSIISNNLSGKSMDQLHLIDDLRNVGETFFCQFFPNQLQSKLKGMTNAYLFFHVDRKLRNIPWELLHDGSAFLSDKFYIGKNISGNWHDFIKPEKDRLRLLIVADPSEDLEWARKEGEGLFEALNAEVSSDRLDIQLMSGKRITKLNLLNALKDRDIVHYSGHLFHGADPRESGWLLSGGKILRAREIEKAGLEPDLVFSNSCFSSPVSGGKNDNLYLNDMASAFLGAGISNYIGSNWKIRDDSRTFRFAHDFYRAIFEEKSVGEALFEARQKARDRNPTSDLTWGNYVLHGNPVTRIFKSNMRKTFDASRSDLNVQRILDAYPISIAREYQNFINVSENTVSSLKSLSRLLKIVIQILGAIVFSNYRSLKMRGNMPQAGSSMTLSQWMSKIYECLEQMNDHKMNFSVPGLMEALYMHRSDMDKMLLWRNDFLNGRIQEELQESYRVTFQYLLDNMLSAFSFLGKFGIVYLNKEDNTSLSFNGLEIAEQHSIPPGFKDGIITDMINKNKGHLCCYNRKAKILFVLDDFMAYDPIAKNLVLFELEDDVEAAHDLMQH